jgi:hypothetical protein
MRLTPKQHIHGGNLEVSIRGVGHVHVIEATKLRHEEGREREKVGVKRGLGAFCGAKLLKEKVASCWISLDCCVPPSLAFLAEFKCERKSGLDDSESVGSDCDARIGIVIVK